MLTFPIVTYHDITDVDTFRAQVDHYLRHYSVVSLAQVERYLHHREPLPAHPLCITFDDAYPSVYYKAFPVLKAFEVPAAVFVITDLVGTRYAYWWDKIIHYAPAGWTAAQKHAKVWEVKTWDNQRRLDYIAELEETALAPSPQRDHLSWTQLHEMQEARITIGNHTADHPMLDKCTEEEARTTICRARSELQRRGFSGASYFAYPNGNSSGMTRRILKEEDTRLAFLFDHQLTRATDRVLGVSRLSLDTTSHLAKTKFILSGLHSKYLNLKKRLL